jgi:sialate O-acetylesterase
MIRQTVPLVNRFLRTRVAAFAAGGQSWARQLALVGTLALALASARADVRLPGLFSDHMVFQQGATVRVWGWADEGEKVTVQFRGQQVSTPARDGKWMVCLRSLAAGGPDELRVSGKNRILIKDVLVGEVWVCSGQSNMELPLRASYQAQTDIADAANPNLRLFTVPKLRADAPTNNVPATWQACNPQTTPGFSAVGYYFGRELQAARRVPVGLIHTSWGGSPAEVWMSQDVLEANVDYRMNILDAYLPQLKSYQESLAKWEQQTEQLKKEGKTQTRTRPWPPWKPTELYNGMIAPLLPYAIKGAIWYQGESNAGRAYQYRSLFVDMIRNWRRDWKEDDFTFLAVQLAPWDRNKGRALEQITAAPTESDWAELRETQVFATHALPKVGLAIITDVGDKDDIHPTKKQPVGARLARLARKIAYGEPIVATGPTFKKMKVEGGKAMLSFDNVGPGLVARDGELRGFAIAGPDRNFVWAKAVLEADRVVVSSPQVAQPIAVRFGWADFPVVNLYDGEGLPASPFRTDDFPMVSGPKK